MATMVRHRFSVLTSTLPHTGTTEITTTARNGDCATGRPAPGGGWYDGTALVGLGEVRVPVMVLNAVDAVR